MPNTPDTRLASLMAWLQQQPAMGFRLLPDQLRPASADASFRRYFRVPTDSGGSLIAMDAPPDREPLDAFLAVRAAMSASGLRVPRLYSQQLVEGFLLLEDFGSTDLLQKLSSARSRAPADATDEPGGPIHLLYRVALQSLQELQTRPIPSSLSLPLYDQGRLLAELRLFDEWFLGRMHGITLSAGERQRLDLIYVALIDRALAQPTCLVHRDFHSRNLMWLAENPPAVGLLDFQDAVLGPYSYDLVSLLRDAYFQIPETLQLDLVIRHWQGLRAAGAPIHHDAAEFYQDFEWMGLQRHLKVLGIFARLAIRDGKQGYLQDIPLVAEMVTRVAQRFSEFGLLLSLLDRTDQGGRRPKTAYTF